MRIPRKLERPPLVEAVFEIRFAPTPEIGSELLPGFLFHQLSETFPKSEQTALGNIPAQMRRQHPELKYSAHFQMKGDDRTMLVGEHVMSLNVTKYPGWVAFRDEAVRVALALKQTGRVRQLERFSLKFINLVEASPTEVLAGLRIRLDVPGVSLSPNGLRLRFETVEGAFLSIIECNAGATLKTQPSRDGLAFTIDTIKQNPPDGFWENMPSLLDEAHTVLEGLFFGLLSEQSINTFGPVWSPE